MKIKHISSKSSSKFLATRPDESDKESESVRESTGANKMHRITGIYRNLGSNVEEPHYAHNFPSSRYYFWYFLCFFFYLSTVLSVQSVRNEWIKAKIVDNDEKSKILLLVVVVFVVPSLGSLLRTATCP